MSNMLDAELQVVEIQDLRNHLVIALKDLKTLQMAISSMMIDVSSLRQTVLTTPAAKSRYKRNLAGSLKKARPLIDEAMQSYDVLIQNVDEQIQPLKEPPVTGSSIVQ